MSDAVDRKKIFQCRFCGKVLPHHDDGYQQGKQLVDKLG